MHNPPARYALGLDFGTLSCRALLLNLDNPEELVQASSAYACGVMEEELADGTCLSGADWALQDADHYWRAAIEAVAACLPADDSRRQSICGIGVDFTASSPLPSLVDGTPLSRLHPRNPHAYVKLWKHHRAEPQAAAIRAEPVAQPWLKSYGGEVSCEWLMPKALEVCEQAPEMWRAADRFVEAGDWLVHRLTGQWTRNCCAAGFKGMWHGERSWPDRSVLTALHPDFGALTDLLAGALVAPGCSAGGLSGTAAEELGLPQGTPVSAATIDAHSGLLGMGVTAPGTFGMIMGTSSCQLWLDDVERIIPGVMGVVRDGILPGSFAYEAGQAAVGDLFSFYLRRLCPQGGEDVDELELHKQLSADAAALPPGSNGHLILDWLQGNRSVLLNPNLSAVVFGLTMASKPAEIYRACLEATAFGCRRILQAVQASGVEFGSVVACGGLTRNELLMQIYADVLGLPVQVSAVDETVALGAALYGAMAAGVRIDGCASPVARTFQPDPQATTSYAPVFSHYRRMHDLFGLDDGMLPALRSMRSHFDATLSE